MPASSTEGLAESIVDYFEQLCHQLERLQYMSKTTKSTAVVINDIIHNLELVTNFSYKNQNVKVDYYSENYHYI